MTESRTRRAESSAPLGRDHRRAGATAMGWIGACAVAEGIGITAAACASLISRNVPPAAALGVVVAGGLIEGLALGILQGRWLSRRFDGLSAARWAWVTTVVAGLGWALASAPSTFAEDDGAGPGLWFIVAAAAGLGAAMGAVLGLAQAWVLRGAVAHPWRWVGISALAWIPAMAVIFVGATLPDARWSAASVIVTGLVSGVAAGALLGAVTYPLMPALSPPRR